MPASADEVIAANGHIGGTTAIEGLVGQYDEATRSGSIAGAGRTGPIAITFQCTVSNVVVPRL